jgi:ATP-dependent helicase/nuclease subunit A
VSPAGTQLAYRVDDGLVMPRDFYRIACDPQRSVVVEACAGAGKTWMLVSRMLRALLDGAEPGEILAITFTRKAAGEMRQRLEEWLHQFARASAELRCEELRARGCTDAEALALEPRLGTLYARLLAAGRAPEIRTFHGWFGQLLRAAPLALLEPLGLHADVEAIEDREDLRPDYTRRFLRTVAADASLRADYAALIQQHGRRRVQEWLETAIEQRVEFDRADAVGVLDRSLPPAAVLWPAFAAWPRPEGAIREAGLVCALLDLAREMGATTGKLQPQAAQAIVAALEQIDDRRAFDGVWRALHTQKDTPSQQLGKREAQRVICERLAEIRQAIAQQEAHDTHARLVRCARAMLAAYADVKRRRGLADMADLEVCAAHLLADADLSAWVQERLDARVRHLLIDEFQDTSPLQWRTLEGWLAGYAGAGGGASGRKPPSIFIVGDPKQSIYGFRRADPRVFAAARDFVVVAFDGARLACDHTRRNAPAVIATLNAVFDQAQADGEFADFRAHTTSVEGVPGRVGLLPLVPRPETVRGAKEPNVWRDTLTTPRIEAEEALRLLEARSVADTIVQLVQRQGWHPRDILVLGRKRATLSFVAQALRERGIAQVLPEQRRLADAPEAADLLALLDALVLSSHELSLARALKSPVFGASDDDLVALAVAARDAVDGRGSWWDALMARPSASAALTRARELLPRWREAARQLPPHDLLDRIVHEGEVHARYAAALPPAARALGLRAIDALLGEALRLDGARYATPYNFVRALRQRRVLLPVQADDDAVQLLTIHGAKGLEARAVFLIDTEPEAPRAATARLYVDWPAGAAAPTCCAFVASAMPPSLSGFAEAEAGREAREELNALYVAMTRAKELLVLSATAAHRAAPGISARARVLAALGQGADVVGAVDVGSVASREPRGRTGEAAAADAPRFDGDDSQGGGSAAAPIELLELPRLTFTATMAVQSPSPRVVPTAAGTAMLMDSACAQLGRAVHRVLEWQSQPRAARDLLAAATAAAAEFGLSADAPARVAALASAVLGSADCAAFFDPTRFAWAGNEVAIGWRGQVLRMDRLVAVREAEAEVWWVLDYKLRHDPQAVPAYVDQLTAYRDAVRAQRPGAQVRAAFITGQGGLIELAA